MTTYVDTALNQMNATVGSLTPEKGGSLLGFPSLNIVTEFIFDDDATTTTSTYEPSSGLSEKTKVVERRGSVSYVGHLHSHPGRMNVPSYLDEQMALQALDINPHMSSFVMPIFTQDSPFGIGDHLFNTDVGTLSNYVVDRSTMCNRTKRKLDHVADFMKSIRPVSEQLPTQWGAWIDPTVQLKDKVYRLEDVHVMHVDRDTGHIESLLSDEMGLPNKTSYGYVDIGWNQFITRSLIYSDCVIDILFPLAYPVCKPVVTYKYNSALSSVHEVIFAWSVSRDIERLLMHIANQTLKVHHTSVSKGGFRMAQ